MISNSGLEDRLKALQLSLQKSESKFDSLKDQLKSAKKEITDSRGAIIEIERLLHSYQD